MVKDETKMNKKLTNSCVTGPINRTVQQKHDILLSNQKKKIGL